MSPVYNGDFVKFFFSLRDTGVIVQKLLYSTQSTYAKQGFIFTRDGGTGCLKAAERGRSAGVRSLTSLLKSSFDTPNCAFQFAVFKVASFASMFTQCDSHLGTEYLRPRRLPPQRRTSSSTRFAVASSSSYDYA